MAIETLDDIVEALADHYAVYGAHDEQCGSPDNPQKARGCRCCWTAWLKSRIRNAVIVEQQLEAGRLALRRKEANGDGDE